MEKMFKNRDLEIIVQILSQQEENLPFNKEVDAQSHLLVFCIFCIFVFLMTLVIENRNLANFFNKFLYIRRRDPNAFVKK